MTLGKSTTWRVRPRAGRLAAELVKDFVEKPWWEMLNLSDYVDKLVETGLSKKDAVKQVAKDRGLQKREVYNEVMVD